jgi:transposase
MFEIKPKARIFVYQKPADLRKGFGGLFTLICAELEQDIFQGDLFLFFNKNRNLVKCMFCDGTGFCIFSKKITEKRFPNLWNKGEQKTLKISKTQLQYLLRGASMKTILLEKL